MALKLLADHEDSVQLFMAYAELEELSNKREEVIKIYKRAVNPIQKHSKLAPFHDMFKKLMKKYGDTQTSDEASLVMEKMDFEDKVSLNPLDYDSWSDYITLEEERIGTFHTTRELYKRAISNAPAEQNKRR